MYVGAAQVMSSANHESQRPHHHHHHHHQQQQHHHHHHQQQQQHRQHQSVTSSTSVPPSVGAHNNHLQQHQHHHHQHHLHPQQQVAFNADLTATSNANTHPVGSETSPDHSQHNGLIAHPVAGVSGPPHYVELHVIAGECVSLQLLDGQEQLVAGPATLTMISQQQNPPVPIPVQAPYGHMIYQIADENGTLKHIILSTMDTTSHEESSQLDPGVINLPHGTFRIDQHGDLISVGPTNVPVNTITSGPETHLTGPTLTDTNANQVLIDGIQPTPPHPTSQVIASQIAQPQTYYANYDGCLVAYDAADVTRETNVSMKPMNAQPQPQHHHPHPNHNNHSHLHHHHHHHNQQHNNHHHHHQHNDPTSSGLKSHHHINPAGHYNGVGTTYNSIASANQHTSYYYKLDHEKALNKANGASLSHHKQTHQQQYHNASGYNQPQQVPTTSPRPNLHGAKSSSMKSHRQQQHSQQHPAIRADQTTHANQTTIDSDINEVQRSNYANKNLHNKDNNSYLAADMTNETLCSPTSSVGTRSQTPVDGPASGGSSNRGSGKGSSTGQMQSNGRRRNTRLLKSNSKQPASPTDNKLHQSADSNFSVSPSSKASSPARFQNRANQGQASERRSLGHINSSTLNSSVDSFHIDTSSASPSIDTSSDQPVPQSPARAGGRARSVQHPTKIAEVALMKTSSSSGKISKLDKADLSRSADNEPSKQHHHQLQQQSTDQSHGSHENDQGDEYNHVDVAPASSKLRQGTLTRVQHVASMVEAERIDCSNPSNTLDVSRDEPDKESGLVQKTSSDSSGSHSEVSETHKQEKVGRSVGKLILSESSRSIANQPGEPRQHSSTDFQPLSPTGKANKHNRNKQPSGGNQAIPSSSCNNSSINSSGSNNNNINNTKLDPISSSLSSQHTAPAQTTVGQPNKKAQKTSHHSQHSHNSNKSKQHMDNNIHKTSETDKKSTTCLANAGVAYNGSPSSLSSSSSSFANNLPSSHHRGSNNASSHSGASGNPSTHSNAHNSNNGGNTRTPSTSHHHHHHNHQPSVKLSILVRQGRNKLVNLFGKLVQNSLSTYSDTKFAGLLLVLFTSFAMLLALLIHVYFVAPVTD